MNKQCTNCGQYRVERRNLRMVSGAILSILIGIVFFFMPGVIIFTVFGIGLLAIALPMKGTICRNCKQELIPVKKHG